MKAKGAGTRSAAKVKSPAPNSSMDTFVTVKHHADDKRPVLLQIGVKETKSIVRGKAKPGMLRVEVIFKRSDSARLGVRACLEHTHDEVIVVRHHEASIERAAVKVLDAVAMIGTIYYSEYGRFMDNMVIRAVDPFSASAWGTDCLLTARIVSMARDMILKRKKEKEACDKRNHKMLMLQQAIEIVSGDAGCDCAKIAAAALIMKGQARDEDQ